MREGTKIIVLDGPTQRFLEEFPKLREKLGLTQSELAASINLPIDTYKKHEIHKDTPSLKVLMSLVEYFGYDLSESVNYKYYHQEIPPSELREKLRRYGLNAKELSRLTGYSLSQVKGVIYDLPRSSVLCYAAILEVLRSEQELEYFRRRYCVAHEKGEALGLSWVKKKYLTRGEVAACFGVSPQTVTLWVMRGMLPAGQGARSKKRWLLSELLEYERSGKLRRCSE